MTLEHRVAQDVLQMCRWSKLHFFEHKNTNSHEKPNMARSTTRNRVADLDELFQFAQLVQVQTSALMAPTDATAKSLPCLPQGLKRPCTNMPETRRLHLILGQQAAMDGSQLRKVRNCGRKVVDFGARQMRVHARLAANKYILLTDGCSSKRCLQERACAIQAGPSSRGLPEPNRNSSLTPGYRTKRPTRPSAV